jgi:hypothetical protein
MRATWCREWEGYANRALREAGSHERIDYRSLKDRNIDQAPQPKLGIAGHVRNPISHLVVHPLNEYKFWEGGDPLSLPPN